MAELNPDLLKQAEELDIEVTDAATDETLKAAIDEVLAEDAGKTTDPLDHDGNGKKGGSKAKAKTPGAKTFPYRINRDFWDDAGDRHPKGEILELTAEDAQDGLESGALSRVK